MDIKRGEIIRINLNPTSGREQQGDARPCLVISQTKYNKGRKGMVVVMPITTTVKPDVKTMLPLPTICKIHGSVIAEQVRNLDLNVRWWKTTGEVLSEEFVNQAVDILNIIIR